MEPKSHDIRKHVGLLRHAGHAPYTLADTHSQSESEFRCSFVGACASTASKRLNRFFPFSSCPVRRLASRR